MRRARERRWWIGMLGIAVSVLAGAFRAGACVNTGTPLEPCHCLERMAMISVTPSLSGLINPTASSVFDATVGDIFYDYNGNMTGDVTINAGDTVHWTNNGFDGHTVSAVPGQTDFFDSGVMFHGDIFEHTFNTPGTYIYYCQVHSFVSDGQAFGPQVGQITVLPVPEPTTAAGAVLAITGAAAWVRGSRRRRRHRRPE